jgi:hypothetical protein
VAPIESILLAAKAIQELAETFRRDGHARALAGKMMPLDEIKKILGVDEFLSLRENLSK